MRIVIQGHVYQMLPKVLEVNQINVFKKSEISNQVFD
jgi:hypothetical protein